MHKGNGRDACAGTYTCVLFDLDNTLVDTDQIIRAALELCGCAGVEAVNFSDLRTLSPNELLRRLGQPGAHEAYWRAYQRFVRSKARLLDAKIPEVLKALSERGTRLGIVTSCRKDVTEAALATCNIADFFADCLVTFATCPQRKPHPAPIRRALEMLEHPAQGAAYVGDSERDALASHAAGVDFLIAGWASDLDPQLKRHSPRPPLPQAGELLRLVRGVRQ